MDHVSAPGLVPQNPVFTTEGHMGKEMNREVALPSYSDTSQYSEAAAVLSTNSPAAQSELSDLVNLSQSKKAKLQHRLSDPFRARLLLDVMEVLPKADSVILRRVLEYLEGQLQSKAVGNDSSSGAPGKDATARLAPGSTSSDILPISNPYENVGRSSPWLIDPPRDTSTDVETSQPYAYASIIPRSNNFNPENIRSSSHPTTNSFGNARASMPTPRSIRQPKTQQRSHLSAPSTFSHGPLGPSSSYGSFPEPPLHNQLAEGTFRISTQSTISSGYSQSANSNHTSTTTIDSNNPDMLNALSQATISSVPLSEASAPIQPAFSSDTAPSSNAAQKFVCTDGNCNKTFTRKEGRERHERARHSGVKLTCLRCICTSSCANPCPIVRHNTPFKDPRGDKMKKHLRECHGRYLGRTEKVPRSWLNRYLQFGIGWVCFECGAFLGTWTDNEREINEHGQHCAPWDWWQSVEGLENFLGVENTDSDPVVGLQDGLEKSNLEDGRLDDVSHTGQGTKAVLENKDDDNEYRNDPNAGLW